MLPEKVSVTTTMSVVRTGAQHMSAVACLKEVTCIVEAERKLIGFPTLQGERGPAGTTDYNDLINKPTLGTMSTVNDAPSDGSEYVRKNGNWAVSSGGGGGGTVYWEDIEGDIADNADLQGALDAKANTADLGDLADHDTVNYQTEVTNKPTLGALASKDTADYVTDVTNKPTLGALASQNSIDYTSAYLTNKPTLGALSAKNTADYATDLTNKPTLGTMASVNDAGSDDKTYGRKNGSWVEVTGGGGGSTDWGDIGGTLSDQDDLYNVLLIKAYESDLADEFSMSQSYTAGSCVIYQHRLFMFVQDKAAGSWDDNAAWMMPMANILRYLLSGKQDTLHFDTDPTASSTNPVESGGVYTALSGKANTADLGALAALDSISYTSSYLTNKPTLGSLAALSSISYTSSYLTNKPTLGTLASKNDVSSNDTLYGRKNGAWSAIHVETGATESLTISGTSYTTKTVTFDSSFANTNYIIILTMNCNATVSAFGQVSYAYHSKAKNGFSIKIYNASSAERSGFNIAWAAIQL